MAAAYADASFWLETCGDSLRPRASLRGDVDADVAIVGAGYTGLWTAYHLTRDEPALRIVVVEKDIAGFGASGRNGGWCSALFPVPASTEMRQALVASVDDVGRWCVEHSVDVHYVRGGALQLARTRAQVERLQQEPWTRWLDAPQVDERLRAAGVLGAAHDPDCATLHPGRLVRGLARVVEDAGVRLHEQTPALRIAPGHVDTEHGTVRARVVVRATEGYTTSLPGHRRALVPVYSLVIATEPLGRAVWDEIRWTGREAVADGRRLIIYAQRTADDRIVFGGRGAPYHFGSRVNPAYDRDPRVFNRLRAAMVELWPATAGARITHRWGGPLGVPRDFHPSVRFDRSTGLASAGGYVGDGVAASQLAGRTLTDLVLDRSTPLTALSWVQHRERRWPVEPARWVGVNSGRVLAASIDRSDVLGRRARLRSAVLSRLTGH